MNEIIDENPIISVISKIELLSINTSVEHYKLLTDFVNDISTIDFTNSIVNECIKIRRFHKTKLPDAIIAATA